MALFNSLYFSSVILVLSNLSVLLAVYVYDWTVFQILFLYWLELGVIALINIFKIAIAQGPIREDDNSFAPIFNIKIGGLSAFSQMSRGTLILLFPIHFSLFIYMVWSALDKLFHPTPAFLLSQPLLKFLAVLMISHVLSFLLNFIGRNEYKEVSYVKQAIAPYSRILILYLTLFFSALVIVNFVGEYTLTIWILIFFKIAFDLNAHILEHKKR